MMATEHDYASVSIFAARDRCSLINVGLHANYGNLMTIMCGNGILVL